MAEFNPQTPETQAPNFTGYSRGTNVVPTDTSLGKLFEGLGNVVGAFAEAGDQVVQHNIKNDLYEQYDSINEEFGVGDAAKMEENFDRDPATSPPELEAAGSNLQRLTKAWQSGKLRESHYWARVESVVRQTRAKYPGYRDQIDDMIQSMTGRTPANALRDSLQREAEASAGAVDDLEKRKQNLIDAAAKDGLLTPDMIENPDKYSLSEVRARINEVNGEMLDVKRERDAIALDAERGVNVEKKAYDQALKDTSRLVNRTLADATTVAGKDYKAINDLIRGIADRGGDPNPKEVAELRVRFQQLKGNLLQAVQANVLDAELNDEGATLSTLIGSADKRNEILAVVESRLGSLEQMMVNKEFGLFSHTMAVIEAQKNADVAHLLDQNEIFRRIQAVRELGGSELVGVLFQKGENIIAVEQAILGDNILKMATGEGTVDQAVETMKESGASNAAYGALIKNIKRIMNDPNTPQEVFENFVRGAFDPANSGWLAEMTTDAQPEVYTFLTSPDITARIKEMSKSNPELFQMYTDFATTKFQALFEKTASTVQEGVRGRPIMGPYDDLQITYNPSSHQFTYKGKTGADIKPIGTPIGTIGNPKNFFEAEQRTNIENAVKKINKMLGTLAPILEANGEVVDEKIGVLLQEMGIDLDAPQEPGAINNFFDYLGSVFGRDAEKPENREVGEDEDVPFSKSEPLPQDFKLGDITFFEDTVNVGTEEEPEQMSFSGEPKAAGILGLVRSIESSKKPETAYNIMTGGKVVPLTKMTLNEVLAYQKARINRKMNSAAGAYQIKNSTLAGLKSRLKLTGEELFDEKLQDRLGMALLVGRGYKKYIAGEISKEQFALNLAQEWAAFPHPKTGRSYYKGVGNNKALISVKRFLASL